MKEPKLSDRQKKRSFKKIMKATERWRQQKSQLVMEIKVIVKLSLWSAIKLRIAGIKSKKELSIK